MKDARVVVNEICDKIDAFNMINKMYPYSSCGDGIIISDNTQHGMELLLNDIESDLELLKTDEMINQYDEYDRTEFKIWLNEITIFISSNRSLLDRSKDITWLQQNISVALG